MLFPDHAIDDDDDDDSYSIRHWTDVPPGDVCSVPFSSRGRLRAGPFLARDV